MGQDAVRAVRCRPVGPGPARAPRADREVPRPRCARAGSPGHDPPAPRQRGGHLGPRRAEHLRAHHPRRAADDRRHARRRPAARPTRRRRGPHPHGPQLQADRRRPPRPAGHRRARQHLPRRDPLPVWDPPDAGSATDRRRGVRPHLDGVGAPVADRRAHRPDHHDRPRRDRASAEPHAPRGHAVRVPPRRTAVVAAPSSAPSSSPGRPMQYCPTCQAS